MSQVWNLIADIGGTNARFAAILDGEQETSFQFFHSVDEYPQFENLIAILLDEIATATGCHSAPQRACLAVACPADTETIAFTNSHWRFSKTDLKSLLGCDELIVINDFEAVAHGITELDDSDLIQVGGDAPVERKAIGILGAGTGLGVAGLVPFENGYQVLDTEGGHADYAPINDQQSAVVDCLRAEFGRVSLERLLSGKGILNIYSALCKLDDCARVFSTPADIVSAALAGQDEKAVETLNMFCEGMGSAAGNLALTMGARGGVYIAGGVIPRFQSFFLGSGFRRKFEDKGRFVSYLQPIPVFIVMRENLGLLGAAKKLIREQ